MNKSLIAKTSLLVLAIFSQMSIAQFNPDEPAEAPVSKLFNQTIGSSTSVLQIQGSQLGKVEVRVANVPAVTVSIEVLAPQSKPSRLDDLIGFLEFSESANIKSVTLKTTIPMYFCMHSSHTVNGQTTQTVRGACYGRVLVTLPTTSALSVYSGGKPMNPAAQNNMGVEGLINAMRSESFDSGKMAVLNKFLANKPSFGFKPDEAAQIVPLMLFGSAKKEVVLLLGARVLKSKRLEYYGLIETYIGYFDKEEVIKALDRLP